VIARSSALLLVALGACASPAPRTLQSPDASSDITDASDARADAPVFDVRRDVARFDDAPPSRCAPIAPRDAGAPLHARALSAGRDHTCVLLDDGAVACWGDNARAQLGDGTTLTRARAVRVAGLATAVDVRAGSDHTCALHADGAVSCWGDNTRGQLGDGTTLARSAPVRVVNLTDVTALAVGASHTCALRRGGALVCWGDNASGQLGDGSALDRSAPTTVLTPRPVTALALGAAHTCVALDDGAARCFGLNPHGQLGDCSALDQRAPVAVRSLTNVRALTAGERHTCARTADDALWCWGDNGFGQSGLAAESGCRGANGAAAAQYEPARTPLHVTALAAGAMHTCALLDGAVWCWGSDRYGQLGDCGAVDRFEARAVEGLTGARALTAGGRHTCALRDDDTVWCWGANEFGQLGDDTRLARGTPSPTLD
jgi:alpha-tubulin suppressor-like RCC1 family protein